MLNQPRSLFDDATDSITESGWQVDSRPIGRLCWLFVGFSVPILLIVVRLAYLQFAIGSDFAAPYAQTTETFEDIPTSDGRILTQDGQVLAEDTFELSLHIHYRWLEEPPNDAWLRQQALDRLDRLARRDPVLVQQAKQQVQADRETLWRRIAEETGTPIDELSQRRQAIQQRVERIATHVRENHERKLKAQQTPLETAPQSEWWERIWQRILDELTNAPSRERRGPIVIREELDYHPLLESISLHTAAKFESAPDQFPGLLVRRTSSRVYRDSSLAPHVIGVRTQIQGDEIRARKQQFPDGDPLAYREENRVGRSGIERHRELVLHGMPGQKRIVKNRQGEIITTEVVRHPRPGQDVTLTLHAPLQRQLQSLLARTLAARTGENADPAAGAAIVVMDVRTGAVVAAVSAPDYDLNDLITPTVDRWQELSSDPRRPFFNRVTQMAIAPGSVFKTLTSIALLESGQIDPDAPFYCRGFLDSPQSHRCYIYRHYGVGHQHIGLADAIAQSCNVYFFHGARVIGAEPIVGWADRFGFGRPTGIDLPSEAAGHVPSPTDEGAWYNGDTLGLAIGQSRLAVTPLQITRMMAAVANDGHLVTPHFVQRIGGQFTSGNTLSEPIPGLTPDTLERIREGLERVVAHPGGTGYKAVRSKLVQIAGKTGTAEVGGKEDHAWFAGYAPATSPRYALTVILEHAGSGGTAAGPVAKQTVESLVQLGLINQKSSTTN
ncbi:peptidoglycan D,D-transpeptidase FtsI family protein [Thalassoroseus pseudoceratinae]|uniref:peptidoglycan D,D-transpeptidase FtsI family protein n=1 Tax=Thalassoroseus pseudoceratinae TaxID=2713176 RepID=UPI0014208C07|nr:penicillin-binding transpeptidase domain-containing protein [Thalassoroseus pseudoceratinae]